MKDNRSRMEINEERESLFIDVLGEYGVSYDGDSCLYPYFDQYQRSRFVRRLEQVFNRMIPESRKTHIFYIPMSEVLEMFLL